MSSNGNGTNPFSRLWAMLASDGSRSEPDPAPYRRLALQLHHGLPRAEAPRSVLLVTPSRSGLTSHGAALLATSAAEELGGPVLLVDASPSEAALTRLLGTEGAPGLTDLLADSAPPVDELLLPTSHEKVTFLPAGSIPLGALADGGIDALLEALQSRSDIVFFCGGAVLGESMALRLASHVGCVLLLAVENETTVEDLDAARDALAYAKARRVGLVLTSPLGSGG